MSKNKNKFPFLLTIILLLGIFSTFYTYINVHQNQLDKFTQRAESISLAINPNEILLLQGNESDLVSENYIQIKKRLTNIREANNDFSFVYLMGRNQDNYFFYADSESPESEDYSPPGQLYEDDAEDLDYVFQYQKSLSTFISDSWGSWISASAPIIQNGEVVGILGIDIDKNLYIQTIFVYTMIPISITLILSIIIAAIYILEKKSREILELRSNFVAIAAHDLRSPLTGIKWTTELLLKTTPPMSEEQMNYIKDIDKSSNVLMEFIEDLLDASSVEKSKSKDLVKEKTDLISLLNQSILPLESVLKEKNIELIKPKAEITINLDKDKMRRVFSNIISNAIKYSPNDSKIEIEVEKDRNNLIIYFKDQGIGIPKSEQKKIFTGYYRAKNAKFFTTKGTGLGLFYSSNIIKAHDGLLSIDSAENRGTTMIVELPIE